MPFEACYTDDQFLNVLSKNSPKSTADVVKELGCDRNTVKRYLNRLEAAGKVKKITVGKSIFGWLKTEEASQESMKHIANSASMDIKAEKMKIGNHDGVGVITDEMTDRKTKDKQSIAKEEMAKEKDRIHREIGETFKNIRKEFLSISNEYSNINDIFSRLNIKKIEEGDSEELNKLTETQKLWRYLDQQNRDINNLIKEFYSDVEYLQEIIKRN